MTTVIDPSGTPSPVYNRSGKTIILGLQGGAQTGPNFPLPIGNVGVPITSYSEVTVVIGLGNVTGYVLLLPSTAEIGDVVMVGTDPTSTHGIAVFGVIGDSIGSLPANVGTNNLAGLGIDPLRGSTFIKVTSTSWQPF